MSTRCECCDLLIESCGRAKEAAQRAEHRRAIKHLLSAGWFDAEYAGTCAHCREWFGAGTLIRHHANGWLAECCSGEQL